MAIDLCDLANILNKIVLSKHWKWLFRASRFKISKYSMGKNSQTPAHPIGVIHWGLKSIQILHTEKVGQSVYYDVHLKFSF